MDLINALFEFNQAVNYTTSIRCAHINYTPAIGIWELYNETPPPSKTITLKEGHTVEEFHKFLNELDFQYDRGYGSQELFGTIWLEDGKWLTRSEYDGSEEWVLHTIPHIPAHLRYVESN